MLQRRSRTALALAALFAITACASSRSLDDSLSDLGGNADLKAILIADRSHDYNDVDITLFEGRLMLSGSMRTEAGRVKLIENAGKADNVEEIIDEIVIGDKTSFGQGLADTRIDQTLRAKLIADADVASGRYKISVSKGTVYLIGAARNEPELQQVLSLARGVSGVERVVSHVALRAPGDAQ